MWTHSCYLHAAASNREVCNREVCTRMLGKWTFHSHYLVLKETLKVIIHTPTPKLLLMEHTRYIFVRLGQNMCLIDLNNMAHDETPNSPPMAQSHSTDRSHNYWLVCSNLVLIHWHLTGDIINWHQHRTWVLGTWCMLCTYSTGKRGCQCSRSWSLLISSCFL